MSEKGLDFNPNRKRKQQSDTPTAQVLTPPQPAIQSQSQPSIFRQYPSNYQITHLIGVMFCPTISTLPILLFQ
jgi:hypothetical protein